MRNTILKAVFLTFCISLLFNSALASSGPVMVNMDVSAGQFKAIRLRALPKNAVVAVRLESDGYISVAVVDTINYLKFKFKKSHHPLFVGQVHKRFGFSVTIPKTDDYYLVLDNRKGRESKSVKVMVNAARSGADQLESANKILRTFERQLHRVFVFAPFTFETKQCGEPKAFIEGAGIVLCTEYLYQLYDVLKDKQIAQSALAFSIFHEVGRMLLSEWHHTLSDEKRTANEFATVLMIMVNQGKRAGDISRYLINHPYESKLLRKRLHDLRHPLSVETSRKIIDWLKTPKLVQKWQKVLVPHMQTRLLKKLYQHPTDWTDLPAIKKELAVRRKKFTRQFTPTSLHKMS